MRRPAVLLVTAAAAILIAAVVVMLLTRPDAPGPKGTPSTPPTATSSDTPNGTPTPGSTQTATAPPSDSYPAELELNTIKVTDPCSILDLDHVNASFAATLTEQKSGPGQCTYQDQKAAQNPAEGLTLRINLMPANPPYLQPMFSSLATRTLPSGSEMKSAQTDTAYALILTRGEYTVFLNLTGDRASSTQEQASLALAEETLTWLEENKPDPTPYYLTDEYQQSTSTLNPSAP